VLGRLSDRTTVLFLVALIFMVVLGPPLLGLAALWGSSEAREVHVVEVMLRDGEWVLPLRNGIVPSKPIGFHLVAAVLGSLIGKATPAVVRLVSYIAGIGLVLVTSLLAYRFSSHREERDRRTYAVFAGSMTLTTYLWIRLAVDARVDMIFSFFVSLAIYFGYAAFNFGGSGSEFRRSHCAAFWLASAAAVLCKGPLGLVLPLSIVGISCWFMSGWRRAWSLLFDFKIGWLLFLIPILIWYLSAYLRGGEAFLLRQLLFENIERVTGNERMNSQPFWYYAREFFRVYTPWSIIVCFVIVGYWRDILKPFSLRRESLSPHWLGYIWFGFGFVLFSCASGKRSSYLLPLLPGFLASSSIILCQFWEEMPSLRLVAARLKPVSVLGGIVVYTLVLSLVVINSASLTSPLVIEHFELMRQWIIGWDERLTLWLLCVATLSVYAISSRGTDRWPLAFATASLTALFFLQVGLGFKAQLKGFEQFARVVGETASHHQNLPLVALKEPFDEYMDPILYYLHRPVAISSSCSSIPPHSVVFGRADQLENCCGRHSEADLVQFFQEYGKGQVVTDEARLAVRECFPLQVSQESL
jgi:4-amino-4-deoxy-L-arabinose transferase-like glycosyltransferase